MKITKLARECADSLVENGLLEESSKEPASAIIQGFMIKYCNKLQEIVNNYEGLIEDKEGVLGD